MSISRLFDMFRTPKSVEELQTLAEQQNLERKSREKERSEAETSLGTNQASEDIEIWKGAIARAIRRGHQVISIDNNDETHEHYSRDSKRENAKSVPGLNAKRIFTHSSGFMRSTYVLAYTNQLQKCLGSTFRCSYRLHERRTNDDGYYVGPYDEISVSWFE